MYDKSVRRRRAVLALLVASALLLLTVYFGESAGGGLHSVQRGVLEVVSPIQEGASRALKPVRDLVGWVGDTFDAKGQVADLQDQNAELRRQRDRRHRRRAPEPRARGPAVDSTARARSPARSPVTARVIGQSPDALVLARSSSTRARAAACASTSR